MSRADLDAALDALPAEGGEVSLRRGGSVARIAVTEADRLGVRLRGLEVFRDRPVDVAAEAATLPERLRSLPDRVAPVEVAPDLGGALLRTRPEDLRGDGFVEVEVEPLRAAVRRVRLAEGERAPGELTLTREQLDRLVDELRGDA